MDTKWAILDAALDLFSQKGYAGASIRDICRRVGIKESSLYYYFGSKSALLLSLQEMFIYKAEQSCKALKQAALRIGSVKKAGFLMVSKLFVSEYLLDRFTARFVRVMLMEQAGNEKLRTLFHTYCYEKPLAFYSRIFAELSQSGILRQVESHYLALVYYAPIFYQFTYFLSCPSCTESEKLLFTKRVDYHLNHFWEEYRG